MIKPQTAWADVPTPVVGRMTTKHEPLHPIGRTVA
jgi:hypothetical protein